MKPNKFEIGSQWKTRGGWRAIVVDYVPETEDTFECLVVYHKKDSTTQEHTVIGAKYGSNTGRNEYDLLEPWQEPEEYEGWVNVRKSSETRCNTPLSVTVFPYKTKEQADNSASSDRIACIKIKFTEGDGLDETK